MSKATMNKTIRGVGASGSAVITASDGTNSATATIQCRPAGEIDIDSPLDQIPMGGYVEYTYTFTQADGTPGAAEPTITSDDPTVATISDKVYDTTTGQGSFKATGVVSSTERATTIRLLGSAGGQVISANIEVLVKFATGDFFFSISDPNNLIVGPTGWVHVYFDVTLSDTSINGTYGDIRFNNGVGRGDYSYSEAEHTVTGANSVHDMPTNVQVTVTPDMTSFTGAVADPASMTFYPIPNTTVDQRGKHFTAIAAS